MNTQMTFNKTTRTNNAPARPGLVITGGDMIRSLAQRNDIGAKPLVAPFIFEKETTLLFAETNVGKTILAVQLANEIAEQGYRVAYVDLELSMEQFAARYGGDGVCGIHPNFHRVGIDYTQIPEWVTNIEEWLLQSVESICRTQGIQVVFIDNITFLCNACECGTDAGQLMRRLVALKQTLGVTMIIVGHTPKREAWKSLTADSMAGSKRIANFADAIFAIGFSRRGRNYRYIKQIKARSCPITHGEDNVVTAMLSDEGGNLHFVFGETCHERTHVDEHYGRNQRIRDLRAGGKSVQEICRAEGLSQASVYRIISGGHDDN